MIKNATIMDLKSAIETGSARVIDVRENSEYTAGHVPGAMNLPMHLIPLRADELRDKRDVYVICESGSRSWQVAAFLRQRGIDVVNVVGGTGAWRNAGLPLAMGARA